MNLYEEPAAPSNQSIWGGSFFVILYTYTYIFIYMYVYIYIYICHPIINIDTKIILDISISKPCFEPLAASSRRQAADGVGHRHERRVQRVGHAPDDLVARGTGQPEGVQHRDEAWKMWGFR